MSDFQARLVKHLASKLNCKSVKVSEALDTFSRDPKGASTSKAAKVPKKGAKTTEEKHFCDRIPRNHKKLCGKRARNEIELLDGSKHWYCGTDKSGCT